MLGRLIGEDVEVSSTPPKAWARPVGQGTTRAGYHEPGHQRSRRHAHGGRLTIETANIFSTQYVAIHPDGRVGEYVLLAISDTGDRHGRGHPGPHI